MSEIFEVIMVVCFGVSWPLSIIKQLTTKSAKGKSLLFEALILIGYIFGIISKFLKGTINYVVVFYFLNLITVSIDAAICISYKRKEAKETENK